jgi:hypothetical protein
MKKLLKISLTVLLLTLIGCQMPKFESVEISILDDITTSNQTSIMDITTEDIIELLGVKENPFNHGKVRISTLSNVSLTKIQQSKLNPVISMTEYQELFREAEINRFINDIDSLLHTSYAIERGKPTSSLFRPMHQELSRLAHSNSSKKYAIFYTDLQEHSAIFSSYSKSDMAFFLNHRDEFTNRVLAKAPLPQNLIGLTVYIINSQEQSDVNFQTILDWYYELLTSRGANVYIGANLILN